MKKTFSLIFLSLLLLVSAYSKPINQKNDMIVSEKEKGNIIFTTYTHIQELDGFEESYVVYKTPSETTKIFDLENSTPTKILQIQVQANSKTKEESVWYKIEVNNRTGWIKTDYNPYKKDNWSVIETIEIDGLNKTVRKTSEDCKLLTWHDKGELVTLYSKPSAESEVIFATSRNEETVTVIAMTDEPEICKAYHDRKEYWVKVRLNDTEGWIFGTQLDTGRGGKKYYDIPADSISRILEISLI